MTGQAIRQDYEQRQETVGIGAVIPRVAELEAEGWFGITLDWLGETVGVRAWKKKDIPCYETGRSATYSGPCLAVGDDDNHFIAGSIRVCEKTGAVYSSQAYRDHLSVSEADPALYARLGSDPVPFDCDTLSADAASIAEGIEFSAEPPEETVVYLGPFRYLCLSNGVIIRRGLPVSISAKQRASLASAGYVKALPFSAPPAENFLDLYRKYGPLFLVGQGGGKSTLRIPALSALDDLTESSRARVITMIEKKEPYFMLQGSDPATDGCCPLPAVGEFNKLTGSGLFESWLSPMSDDCPVTAYALTGEIGRVSEELPDFRRNDLMRLAVYEYLTSNGRVSGER